MKIPYHQLVTNKMVKSLPNKDINRLVEKVGATNVPELAKERERRNRKNEKKI